MVLRLRLYSILICLALALFGLALRAAPAQAAPAAPVDIPITQPDGSTFTSRVWGDEYQHGMETLEGYTILKDEQTGYWIYAAAQDGTLAPARSTEQRLLVVGKDSPAALGKHARPAAPEVTMFDPLARGMTPPMNDPEDIPPVPSSDGLQLTPNTGTQAVLVVMVSFKDTHFTYTPAQIGDRVFGPNGSLSAFYNQASYGKLSFSRVWESNGVLTMELSKLS